MSGLLCDRRVPTRMKGKIHQTVAPPSMIYGLETVGRTKNQEAEVDLEEIRMLRFALGVTRKDKIRSEYIRETVKGQISKKAREARLRWYWHVKRREDAYVGRRVLEIKLPGKKKVGRPKRRFMDVAKEGMREAGNTEEEVHDRRNWRMKIRYGDHQ